MFKSTKLGKSIDVSCPSQATASMLHFMNDYTAMFAEGTGPGNKWATKVGYILSQYDKTKQKPKTKSQKLKMYANQFWIIPWNMGQVVSDNGNIWVASAD